MLIEVFRLPDKDWSACFASEDGWGYVTAHGLVWLAQKPNYMPLLPLLEMAWPVAKKRLAEAMRPSGIEEQFPFEQVIQLALDWETQYWPSLAVDWIEQGFPISVASLPRLQALPSKKFIPQRVRHRASALARKAAPQ